MSARHVDPLGALYAEVLGDVAWERGGEPLVKEVGEALSAFGSAWAQDRTLRAFFLSAQVKKDDKRAALLKILEPMPSLMRDFIRLLIRRGRGHLIDRVATAFEEYLDEKLGRVQVTLSTATPVPEEQKALWMDRLRASLGKEPVLEHVVKPELVAGAVLQVGGTVADGSARRQLQELTERVRERGKHAIQA